MGAGIDYSFGRSNVDHETGIHYGVINQGKVLEAWCDISEAYYGKPHCPYCGTELKEDHEDDTPCSHCEKEIGYVGEECYGDEPISHFIDDEEYSAEGGESGDIFITKSPYYTLCKFCSPCAPGAGYLMNFDDEGIKAYCFGHDFFEDGKAPYPVYTVATGELVPPEKS